MRPLPFSEKSHVPVIEYRERFVQINLLHTEANGYRCRNEGCVCHQAEALRRAMEGDTGPMARMEREWGSPPWRRP